MVDRREYYPFAPQHVELADNYINKLGNLDSTVEISALQNIGVDHEF